MDNPNLVNAFKSSPIFSLGFEPSSLIQYLQNPIQSNKVNVYDSTLQGAYSWNAPKGSSILAKEAEKRDMNEYVYSNPLDRNYIDKMDRMLEKPENQLEMSREEFDNLKNYMGSDNYTHSTMFEEFFHRGMRQIDPEIGNEDQDMLLSALRIKNAPDDLKDSMKKFVKYMERGLPTKSAYNAIEEYEQKAKEVLDKKTEGYTIGKRKGLLQNALNIFK
jgi:hypothetical protein